MNENPYEKLYGSNADNQDDNYKREPEQKAVTDAAFSESQNGFAAPSAENSSYEDVREFFPASDEGVYTSENHGLDDTHAVSPDFCADVDTDYHVMSDCSPEYNNPQYAPSYEQPVIPSEQQIVSDNSDNAASYGMYGGVPSGEYSAPQYNPPSEPQSRSFREKNKSKGKGTSLAVVLLVCMFVSIIFGAGSAIIVNHFLGDKDKTESDNKVTPQYEVLDLEPGTELSTPSIVDKTGDSVVEIITEYVQTGIFSQQYIKSGAGSGVIIDTDGYIVTNHHVIENAEKISVTLRNGENYIAELMGSDSKMDLALLKIDAPKLTAASFGDSDSLKVGQRTVAIGNPLGQLGGTVTEGIISALDRDVLVDGQTMNLLQTDTAINPGNSGGGLFDGKGNLIGIVVAKSAGSEVEGLGFAIPINDAVSVISDLADYGYVRGRIAIGMEFIDVTSESVAWMYGLSDLGCYVYSVEKDSNAQAAGFQSGDLILSVDGEEVNSSDEIEVQLDKKAVGDTVRFKIKRGRKTGTISLVLEEYVPNKIFNESDDSFSQWGN